MPTTLIEEFCALFEAVNAEGPDALARIDALYDERVVFQDPLVTTLGREAFTALNRRMIERAREIHVEVLDSAGGADHLFVTWRMRYQPRRGPRLDIEGATHARVRDGRIVEQRDYWDLAGSLAAGAPWAGALWRRLTKKLV